MGRRKKGPSEPLIKISTTIPKSLYDELVQRYGNKWRRILERVLVLERENAELREQLETYSAISKELRDNIMKSLGAMNEDLENLERLLAKTKAVTESHEKILKNLKIQDLKKLIVETVYEGFNSIKEEIKFEKEQMEFEKWKSDVALKFLLAILESRGTLSSNAKTIYAAIKAVDKRNASIINKILLEALGDSGGNEE